MCRFIIYQGKDLLLSDLIVHPTHSLIRQSFRAAERTEPLNGDGFGVGWYAPTVSTEPGVFTSIHPAWSDRNLKRLASKILSPCIFAHVRAASPGLGVSEDNCHPFQFGRYLWMHNGHIEGFLKMKRTLQASLPQDVYEWISGSTDSENAFAVFLSLLKNRDKECGVEEIAEAMRQTISKILGWCVDAGVTGASNFNFAVTDGKNIVASRFTSGSEEAPQSLYYSTGKRYLCTNGRCEIEPAQKQQGVVLIASEPVTDDRAIWNEVPANNLVIANQTTGVKTISFT